MKLKDFNNKLKHLLEALSKAREDEGLSPQSKRQLRSEREKFSQPDPVSRMVSTVRPGVSDIGIEARRADPSQTGVISHGYARVLEPKQHAEIAKVKARKVLEALKRQRPLPLPKSEMPQSDEIVLVKHADGTADLLWGSDISNDTIEEFIKVEMADFEESDLAKEEKPFHGYNENKHSKSGGLKDSYRKKYNRETGSNLKRPVTGKVKPGSKAAKRRKSFCARMSGVKGPTSKDGKLTPKGAALKRWKCSKSEGLNKRCWEGYAPVPGKKPYSKGSCAKVSASKILKSLGSKPRLPESDISGEKHKPLMKPYSSEAQRRWANTSAGTKALGGKKAVEHWNKESKGKNLPEKIEKNLKTNFEPLEKGKKDILQMMGTQPEPHHHEFADWASKALPNQNWQIWAARHYRNNPGDFTKEVKQELEHFGGSTHIPEVAKVRFDKEHDLNSGRKIFQDAYSTYNERIKQNKNLVSPSSKTQKVVQGTKPNRHWFGLGVGACENEGKAMGHCGNVPSKTKGDKILSLRTEHKVGDKIYHEPHLTFISNNGFLGEMKGRGNDKPAKEYHQDIANLLKDKRIKGVIGGGYESEKNFDFNDLSPKLQKEVKLANPGLVVLDNEGIEKILSGSVKLPEKHKDVRFAIAKNPNLDPRHHERLVNDEDWSVRSAIAENPNLDPRHYERLVNDDYSLVRSAIAANPSYIKYKQEQSKKLASSEKIGENLKKSQILKNFIKNKTLAKVVIHDSGTDSSVHHDPSYDHFGHPVGDDIKTKDPILNYDKKGPIAISQDQQKKRAAKILSFLNKKTKAQKSEDLNKNKYLKEMMHQMRAEKQAKKDAALKEFHAKKQFAPKPPVSTAAPSGPVSPQPGQQKLFDPDLSGKMQTPFQSKQSAPKVQKAAIGPRIVSGPVEVNRTTISEPMKISGPTILNSDDSNKKVLGNLMSKLKQIKRA
jgi:hypothetical protein